jgi:hypothetical protein
MNLMSATNMPTVPVQRKIRSVIAPGLSSSKKYISGMAKMTPINIVNAIVLI